MHELTIRTPDELSKAEIEKIVAAILSPKNPEIEVLQNGKFVGEWFQHFSAHFPGRPKFTP
jgi:hypothetical protein